VAVDVTLDLPGGNPGRFLQQEPDEALVELVRAGHVSGFEAIYDRHHRGLIAFCRHMLGSREEAEDALQQTFAAAYRALSGGGDRPLALKPWLYTIARNRCLSMLRARKTREAADTPADGSTVEGLADAVQRRAELRDLVDDLHRLPEDQKAALVLFELGDHSHAEIADVLSVEREKVKALVFQAREGLLRARTARDTPCAEIRQHLSSRTRALPRRGMIRRHLDACPACSAFDLEVRRQRAALAIVLPVVPSLELKGSVLGSVLGGGATLAGGGAVLAGAGASAGAGAGGGAGIGAGAAATAAAGAGGAAGAGAAGGIASAGAAGGFGALAAKAVVAKVVAVVAVAGAAGGTVESVVHDSHAPAAAISAPRPAHATVAPQLAGLPAVVPAPAPPPTTVTGVHTVVATTTTTPAVRPSTPASTGGTSPSSLKASAPTPASDPAPSSAPADPAPASEPAATPDPGSASPAPAMEPTPDSTAPGSDPSITATPDPSPGDPAPGADAANNPVITAECVPPLDPTTVAGAAVPSGAAPSGAVPPAATPPAATPPASGPAVAPAGDPAAAPPVDPCADVAPLADPATAPAVTPATAPAAAPVSVAASDASAADSAIPATS
jgi:RNA polymerase sigma factor (sigma-70 family)